MSKKMLRFGAFMSVPGCHPTGWRHPDAICETDISFRWLAHMVRVAERGKLDAMFFQDSAAVVGSNVAYNAEPFNVRNGRQAHIEPVSAIAGLAAITSHIGLISTCTTTYNEPYNLARRFLTIDHISGGRAGWNLVTSQAEDEAGNFGQPAHLEHGARYDRASEFYDVVRGLWDSWEDDAFLRDKASGIWFDIDKMHILNHEGPHFRVRGPLNVSRSPQGRPVVAQAGSSGVGMDLAARSADMVFTAQRTIPDAQAFRSQMHALMAKYGRAPDEVRIFPGIMPIVGRSAAEAQDKYEQLRDLVDDNTGLRGVARLAGGVDILSLDPDGPLPELKPSNAARARQEMIIAMGRSGMTIRQIGRVLGMSQAHRVLYGTPQSMADDMEEWLDAGACDGFNLLFAHYPKPLEEFVDLVVPELQRRGIFRTEYEGNTLRGNLGVPIPRNSFARVPEHA
ncbi:LLM class flavin-dependent oxidoreductase [Acidisphaera sp. L21]|uniref:LLM class flavin-dependent oxidoreductase n=1 Tax=Acidisphaera sp. L21 TaxID=1641851 RepID=UPI00131E50A9|nr:LLM class flavin-dependent oxidoreductase [Acidisphaera sp. L21]